MLRKTAAGFVAASAVLLAPGAGQAVPTPDQVVQAVADSAAATYREERRAVLRRYRERTAQAQQTLADAMARARNAQQRRAALRQYKADTAAARAQAHAAMQSAREAFRQAVARARGTV